MKRLRGPLAAVITLTLIVSSKLAVAEPLGPGGYFGGGIGQSTMTDANNTLLGTTTQDQDTAFKFFGGVMFNPYVGFEIGYVDFGRFSGEFPREDWKASGVNFSLIAAVPIPDARSNFSLFGKIGANAWSVDDSLPFALISASGTSPSYGIGGEIELNRQIGLNLQWERFADVGDVNTTGRSDIDLVTANLVVRFRPTPVPYGHPRYGRY